jgi:hypothetical protein
LIKQPLVTERDARPVQHARQTRIISRLLYARSSLLPPFAQGKAHAHQLRYGKGLSARARELAESADRGACPRVRVSKRMPRRARFSDRYNEIKPNPALLSYPTRPELELCWPAAISGEARERIAIPERCVASPPLLLEELANGRSSERRRRCLDTDDAFSAPRSGLRLHRRSRVRII